LFLLNRSLRKFNYSSWLFYLFTKHCWLHKRSISHQSCRWWPDCTMAVGEADVLLAFDCEILTYLYWLL